MTSYTRVFGGTTIYPSEVSYQAYTVTSSTSPINLQWPLESNTANIAARILDVTATSAGLQMSMPDATLASDGETILFNNIGTYAFTVVDYNKTTLVNVQPGTAWQIYLYDNTTQAGAWRSFQFGASISQANAASLAGAGLTAIGATLNTAMAVTGLASNYTLGLPDRATAFNWIGANGTLTLPNAGTAGNNWFFNVRNSGTGNLSIAATGSNTINASSSINLSPADSAIVVCDGVNFFTVGLGKNAVFAFDYTSISVAGTGNYTLSGTELNRISYRFTGTLTGNRVVIVPTTIQQYWVDNETTGSYTLTIKTAAGTGYIVPQGTRAILYCDGTNVVNADTASISTPIAISNGGTGATTAGGALISLGGTSVGIGVFTASSAAVARSDLGSTTIGDAVFTATSQTAALTALGAASQDDVVYLAGLIVQVENDALAYSVAMG